MQIIEVFCVVGIVYMVFYGVISVLHYRSSAKHTERFLKLNPEFDPIAEYIHDHKKYLCKLEERMKELEIGCEISVETE